jgi:hypothetical protein
MSSHEREKKKLHGSTEENHKTVSGHAMAQKVSLLHWRLGFDPRSVHVGFVVEEKAIGQVFL